MPRHKGKKKKGKVVRAQDMKDTVKTAMVNNLNEKLMGAGLAKVKGLSNLELPSNKTAAASGEGTDSQLDESVYSYYSQSVNQSALNDDLNSTSGAPATEEQVDVNNIKADINASEQEESKGEATNAPRQVLTTRGEQKSKIEFEETKAVPQSARQSEPIVTQTQQEETSSKEINQNGDGSKDEEVTTPEEQASKTNDVEILHQELKSKKSNDSAQETNEKTIIDQDAHDDDDKKVVDQVEEINDDAFFDDFDAAFGGEEPLIQKKDVKKVEKETPKLETPKPEVQETPELKAEKPSETVVEKQEQQPKVQEQFFDDFEAAFGPENDVPIIKQAKKEPVQSKEESTETKEKVEAKKEVTFKKQPEPVVSTSQEPTEKATPATPQLDSSKVSDQKTADSQSVQASHMLGPRLGEDLASSSAAPSQASSTSTKLQQPEQSSQPQQNFAIKPVQTKPKTTEETAKSTEPVAKVPTQKVEVAKPTPEVKKADATEVQTVQIDTTKKAQPIEQVQRVNDVKIESKETPKEAKDISKTQKQEEKEESSDDEQSQEGSAGGRVLFYGAMCLAAAGAYFYVKKNNIPVEEIVKRNFDRLQDRIQQMRRH